MSRRVIGLELAERSVRPAGLPKFNRPRGAKKLGVAFERSLGPKLPPGAKSGLWWRFVDRQGPGICQTDWVIEGARATLVLECKLGQHWEAWDQLEGLYGPVLQLALGKPVVGIQVCKFLRPEFRRPGEQVCHRLEEGIELARAGVRPLLHWSGLGPLFGTVTRSHPTRGTVPVEAVLVQ